MAIGGLTDKEEEEWCKSKADYKPLWLKKNKTPAEIAKLRLMMEQYRDWNRYKAIKKEQTELKYSPTKHKSKLFGKMRQGVD